MKRDTRTCLACGTCCRIVAARASTLLPTPPSTHLAVAVAAGRPTPHIVPTACVSMATVLEGFVAGSKVWRNLPDNPEGQHTQFQLTVCVTESLSAFPLLYGHA